jgi:hypothetical protein
MKYASGNFDSLAFLFNTMKQQFELGWYRIISFGPYNKKEFGRIYFKIIYSLALQPERIELIRIERLENHHEAR